MNQQKHTPGPWQIAIGRYILAKVGPPRHERCTLEIAVMSKDDDWEEEQQANARLITSAPDLLDALKELVAKAEQTGCVGAYWDTARAAILKAEGGQP
jgi:hypothetical protein